MEELLREQFVRLLRYAYPGFLLLFLYAWKDGCGFKAFHDNAGTVLVALFGLTLGAMVFVAYRFVLGELIIFPLVNAAHTLLSRRFPIKAGVTGWVGLEFHVPLGQRRSAYGYLRSECGDAAEVRKVDLIHTELHILYLSSVILSALGAYGFTAGQVSLGQVRLAGFLFFVAAVIADMHVHIRERIYFETVVGADRVGKLLQKGGYVRPAQSGKLSEA